MFLGCIHLKRLIWERDKMDLSGLESGVCVIILKEFEW